MQDHPLSKYRSLFTQNLEQLLKNEFTTTIQAITKQYLNGHYDVNEAVGDLRRRLTEKLALSKIPSKEDPKPHESPEKEESQDQNTLAKVETKEIDQKTENKVDEVPVTPPALQNKITLSGGPPKSPSRNRLFDELFVEISMFFWNLSRSAGVWGLLLRDEQLTSASRIIDLFQFISQAYIRLTIQGSKTCLYFRDFCKIVRSPILKLLEQVSLCITMSYNENKKLIIQLIDELNTNTKNMRLINKYMIYKLLRELSQCCFEQVRQGLNSSVFKNVQPQMLDYLTEFIISKHDIISFSNQQLQVEETHDTETLAKQLDNKLLKRLSTKHGRHVHLTDAIRQDGKAGILVKVDSDDSKQPEETYMVKLNDDGSTLDVVDAAGLQKKWSFNASSADLGPEQLATQKDTMVEKLKSAPTKIGKMTVQSGIETLGGSLGGCLANIRNYDSVGSFMVDFSSKTVVSGSINYIVQRIPIMGLLMVAGGFSYSFYRVIRSKFKTTSEKFRNLGKMVLNTGTNIGAGVIGGIVGEILIPIPILGMFVGSVVGGFLGNLGSDVLMKALESKRFEEQAHYLDKHITINGSWEATDQLLDMLGVTRKSFEKSVPKCLKNHRQDPQKLWITVICFCLLSFYESRKDRQRLAQTIKTIEKEDPQQAKLHVQPSNETPKSQSSQKAEKKDSKDGSETIAHIKQEVRQYISLNLEMTIHYLQKQDIRLHWCLGQISHFLEKLFKG